MVAVLHPKNAPAEGARSRIDIGRVLYVALHAAGFLLTTLLMVWGLLVLFLLAIGGFSLDGLMHQLANLSIRYVAADPARVAGFKTVVGVAHLLLAAALVFFRRHAVRAPEPLHRSLPHVR